MDDETNFHRPMFNRSEVIVVRKGKKCIAVRKQPHRYGNSRATWDHTVLPATQQR